MKKALLFLLALAGLPFAWACARALLESLAAGLTGDAFLAPGCIAFFSGAAAMAALYFWKGRALSVVYVFAHEMTHALVGLCFLARVHRVSVRATGGFVELSKCNLAITLAPYCVPFYLLLALLLRLLVGLLWPHQPLWPWAALFGAAAAFHLLYTIDALVTVAQPDVRAYGSLFSYWLILVVNLLFALLALVAVGHVGPRAQAHALRAHTVEAYAAVADLARRALPRDTP